MKKQKQISVWVCVCDNADCAHEWQSRDENVPSKCPRCQKANWDEMGLEMPKSAAERLDELLPPPRTYESVGKPLVEILGNDKAAFLDLNEWRDEPSEEVAENERVIEPVYD
jgi:hypothetical protein